MTSSLLSDLKPLSEMKSCRVRTILSQLSVEDKKILEDALADHGTWSANGLMTALNQRGIDVSVHPILKHRKGICKCFRT